MKQGTMLPSAFYKRNTIIVARELLGKYLVVNDPSHKQVGMIVETEAYRGTKDKACHGSWRKRASCLNLWGKPGHLYVYLTYGLHFLLNIVTEKDNFPSAVLIRSLEPIENISLPTNGPGKLTKSLGIDKSFDGQSLISKKVFITIGRSVSKSQIIPRTRIGVSYAKEWQDKPWRFYLQGNKFVSKN